MRRAALFSSAGTPLPAPLVEAALELLGGGAGGGVRPDGFVQQRLERGRLDLEDAWLRVDGDRCVVAAGAAHASCRRRL